MRLLSFCFIFSLVSACISTWDQDVEISDPPEDDRPYLKVHDRSTKDYKIIVDFETRYTIAATYLSPEFRGAFASRFRKLYESPQPFLEEASNKAGFFVTIFSPEFDHYDITDAQLWSIQLKVGEESLKPSLVKKLNNKGRWLPFFPHVHRWSSEYLVLFDTPSVSTGEMLVKKNHLDLMIANSDAKINFKW